MPIGGGAAPRCLLFCDFIRRLDGQKHAPRRRYALLLIRLVYIYFVQTVCFVHVVTCRLQAIWRQSDCIATAVDCAGNLFIDETWR